MLCTDNQKKSASYQAKRDISHLFKVEREFTKPTILKNYEKNLYHIILYRIYFTIL